ncbi:Variant-specific surface protein [Giardia duodenalis]|uniref:Variant-specific surface protein n=1 Tax=Giardia intestinalis TaxID=5741 RepID=V6TSG6_GIAIN|nr:Variant-specific surface protein [Giardia intestinalis]
MLAIYLAVGALAAECKSVSQTSTCAQCETVGTTEVCTECQTGGKVPIDGVCVDKNEATGKCKTANGGAINTEKACGQCGAGYFLHKGGCYKFGNEVAVLICNDAASPGGRAAAVDGVCSECNTTGGFFRNPEAAANTDSCISCGDATGVQVGNNKYKGVLNCATCTAPEVGSSSEQTASCTACVDGYFDPPTCGTQCHINCKACSGGNEASKCTSCKADNPYLKKTQSTSQVGECVAADTCAQGNTHYADANTDPKTCKACAEGTFEGCKTCEKSTEGAVACKTCGSQKKIRPDKKGCIDACPPDVSTEKNGVCECVEGYTPSDDKSRCEPFSTNKSSLSTGAIAGISVAVIVVVGGLVGFLCWWFICHKKSRRRRTVSNRA